jgi:hypothetical protein
MLLVSGVGRIEFLFECRDSFEPPSVHELLGSLANEFSLHAAPRRTVHLFSQGGTEENLLFTDRGSLEISLDIKFEKK